MTQSGTDLMQQAKEIKAGMPFVRGDGRKADEVRPLTIETGFTSQAEGSVLISTGKTRVICTASVEEKVPHFLRGARKGWVTAEYGMLPRSTSSRMVREATSGKAGGRTLEIQRLIGRSLRSVVELEHLGERTIWLDCDVIQADGGTRTASITGAYVALVLALRKVQEKHPFRTPPLTRQLAAVSVGMVDQRPLLDLDYSEDSTAEVDLNVVMTADCQLIEIQGTAEKEPFSRSQLTALLDLTEIGIAHHAQKQLEVLDGHIL